MGGTVLHSRSRRPGKDRGPRCPQPRSPFPARRPQVGRPCAHGDPQPAGGSVLFLGSAYESDMRRAGTQVSVGVGRGEAIMMSRAGDTSIAADVAPRRRVVVDVILLLMRNGRILLRERANTGYGDGAYEPPPGQLSDRETIVETAIRVAAAEAGIAGRAVNVSLAHVMHDVSGSGRIAFFLTVTGWHGEYTSPDARWFPVA